MSIYKKIISPILDHLDSEMMHVKAKELIHFASFNTFGVGSFFLRRYAFKDKKLNIVIEGIDFENPVLVGAGWDKTGDAVKGLIEMGFGGVEVGTVPEYPQEGNPKPRQFMIANGVAINRLGFNSPGMEKVAEKLEKYKGLNLPIGISVGINKNISEKDAPAAHAKVVDRLYDLGKYFVINVSSPNTPGLRGLQSKKPLTDIVLAVQKIMKEHRKEKPLFVKIAPDMDEKAIDDVLDVVEKTKINGIIATNTLLNQKIKSKYLITDKRLARFDENGKGRTWDMEMGGLSGDDEDYRKISTNIVRYIYQQSKKKKLNITIIGVGGIKDGSTALERIKAGANLIQIVTAIRGEGIGIAGVINHAIVKEIERLKLKNVEDLVGYDLKNR